MFTLSTRRTCLGMLATLPFLGATKSSAMFAKLSQKDLVESSELIVTGTLAQVEMTSGSAPRRVGTLDIINVLKGAPDLEEARLLLPEGAGLRSSSDIDYATGSTGLWFLRAADPEAPELYAADSPQRFIPESEVATVLKSIASYLPE